jgi:hypothetical protein
MSSSFTAADGAILKAHLVALANVELFTVPVYLTAVYSFTQAALGYSDPGGDSSKTPYDVQQKALSVAVQEMYHAQLACNIANAFQAAPALDTSALSLASGVTLTVPHLDPQGQDLQLKLGDLSELIPAMIAVETPDPSPNFPTPNSEAVYASISDLYHATLALLGGYLEAYANTPQELDPHFKSNNLQIAAKTFLSRYKYNTAVSRTDVESMADAITDQGEGKVVAGSDAPAAVTAHFGTGGGDPDTVDADYQSTPGSRFYKYDGITHYGRFEAIRSTLDAQMQNWEAAGTVFYQAGQPSADLPAWAQQKDPALFQTALGYAWSYLIDTMQATVAPPDAAGGGGGTLDLPPDFYTVMFSLKYIIPLVWQTGNCPAYTYQPGVTIDQIQTSLDQIDPYCLMHWDAKTADLRAKAGQSETYTATLPNGTTVEQTYQLNACQGLNVCATQGWGELATQPGDGACATADFHSCQGGNSCRHQGGCGFISSQLPPTEQWVPGQNSCAPPSQPVTTGGCQTPISDGQYFDPGATFPSGWPAAAVERLTKLKNTPVWDEARNLLASSLGLQSAQQLPAGSQTGTSDNVVYNGSERRQYVPATSTKAASTGGAGGGSGEGGGA